MRVCQRMQRMGRKGRKGRKGKEGEAMGREGSVLTCTRSCCSMAWYLRQQRLMASIHSCFDWGLGARIVICLGCPFFL